MAVHTKSRRLIRSGAVIFLSALIVFTLFRLTEAGSLTPVAAPASTMNTLTQVYDALVGTTFDSSAVVASKQGNALQVAKCIIDKMTGGTPCP